METKKNPRFLKYYFVLHFLVDFLFAIPLLFVPMWTAELLGFEGESDLAVRLVGAALIGIGGVSLIASEKGRGSYESLLTLKILWSSAAVLAIALYLNDGGQAWSALPLLGVFAAFWLIWTYYRWRLSFWKNL